MMSQNVHNNIPSCLREVEITQVCGSACKVVAVQAQHVSHAVT